MAGQWHNEHPTTLISVWTSLYDKYASSEACRLTIAGVLYKHLELHGLCRYLTFFFLGSRGAEIRVCRIHYGMTRRSLQHIVTPL